MTTRNLPIRGRMAGVEPWHPPVEDTRPDWFTDARPACAPIWGGDHLFTSDDPKDRADAVERCQACPFRADCRAWARAHGETWGVWGGLDLCKAADRAEIAASSHETTSLMPTHEIEVSV